MEGRGEAGRRPLSEGRKGRREIIETTQMQRLHRGRNGTAERGHGKDGALDPLCIRRSRHRSAPAAQP